jgi:hypothetical protein
MLPLWLRIILVGGVSIGVVSSLTTVSVALAHYLPTASIALGHFCTYTLQLKRSQP